MFANKIIFITGGTGSWGQAIVKYLLSFNVKKIIIFSRHEDKQVSMERQFNDSKLLFILGDVRNKELLSKITIGVDYIIHLAALKHVYKCEQNPEEAISINIAGTQNIIDVCIANNIKKALYISTDKACEPYNLYGNTKAIGEKLFLNANNLLNNKNTIFFVLRTGNVIGSRGSVLKVFHEQIKNSEEIRVTDLKMRRFFIDINKILEYLDFIFKNVKGGELYIVGGPILSLKSLLNIMIDIYSNGNERIIEIGARQGEKFDEILINNNEKNKAFKISEDFFVISDNYKGERVREEYSTKCGDKFDKEKIKYLLQNLFSK